MFRFFYIEKDTNLLCFETDFLRYKDKTNKESVKIHLRIGDIYYIPHNNKLYIITLNGYDIYSFEHFSFTHLCEKDYILANSTTNNRGLLFKNYEINDNEIQFYQFDNVSGFIREKEENSIYNYDYIGNIFIDDISLIKENVENINLEQEQLINIQLHDYLYQYIVNDGLSNANKSYIKKYLEKINNYMSSIAFMIIDENNYRRTNYSINEVIKRKEDKTLKEENIYISPLIRTRVYKNKYYYNEIKAELVYTIKNYHGSIYVNEDNPKGLMFYFNKDGFVCLFDYCKKEIIYLDKTDFKNLNIDIQYKEDNNVILPIHRLEFIYYLINEL